MGAIGAGHDQLSCVNQRKPDSDNRGPATENYGAESDNRGPQAEDYGAESEDRGPG